MKRNFTHHYTTIIARCKMTNQNDTFDSTTLQTAIGRPYANRIAYASETPIRLPDFVYNQRWRKAMTPRYDDLVDLPICTAYNDPPRRRQ